MALAITILIVVLVSWGLIALAIRQERDMRALDPAAMIHLQTQARADARAQSGALADLPSWRSLQPRVDHPFLGPVVWNRLIAWGDTIERGLEARHARDEAVLKGVARRYEQRREAVRQLECTRALAGYEINARLVHHIRSVLQHEADAQAGPAGERVSGKQLAKDRLFVELLQGRVESEAKLQGWSPERLDVALQGARKTWAPNASCTTSPGRFINTVLKMQEL